MKQKILISFVVSVSVSLAAACLSVSSPSTHQQKEITSQISYDKDERTGLCFAVLISHNSYGQVASITNVPCEKVENQLK